LVKTDRLILVGSVVAATLGFCYFVQQQRLAETTLFKQLFSEFNARYDGMNGKLAAIAKLDIAPGENEKAEIVDYFNLCAEEYLFYKEGYIHLEAWRSWCMGMLWYFEREPFKGMWETEVGTGSYYGLSLEVIRRGAGLTSGQR
jgi:hypothetical protein